MECVLGLCPISYVTRHCLLSHHFIEKCIVNVSSCYPLKNPAITFCYKSVQRSEQRLSKIIEIGDVWLQHTLPARSIHLVVLNSRLRFFIQFRLLKLISSNLVVLFYFVHLRIVFIGILNSGGIFCIDSGDL